MCCRHLSLLFTGMLLSLAAGWPGSVSAEQVPTDVVQLDGVWVWEQGPVRTVFRLTGGRVPGTTVQFQLKGGQLTSESGLEGRAVRLLPGPAGSWLGPAAPEGARLTLRRYMPDAVTFPRTLDTLAGRWRLTRRGVGTSAEVSGDELRSEGQPLGRLELRDSSLVVRRERSEDMTAVLFRLEDGSWTGLEAPSGALVTLVRPAETR